MQFNYVDHEGYRRVDKRKAKRLFNLGYTIHLIPSNAGINTHHKTISKAKYLILTGTYKLIKIAFVGVQMNIQHL